jgi:hypothetical protein
LTIWSPPMSLGFQVDGPHFLPKNNEDREL